MMRIHMRAGDLSDLYLLVLCYARTYFRSDDQRYSELMTLANEIKQMYREDFPEAIPIAENRNTRGAGRPPSYSDTFRAEIIALREEGYGPTEIAAMKKCSKSYVSKLIRKR